MLNIVSLARGGSCLAAGLLAGLTASLLAGLTASAALAAPLPIVNAGFEANPAPPGAFVVGLPSGWSAYDPQGVLDQAADALGVIRPLPGTEFFPGGTPEGDHAAIVYLGGGQGAAAGLQQTLAATLAANTRYTLSVGVGNIASGTSLPGSSGGAGRFYNLAGFPGYRIELLAGTTLLAADHNRLGALIPEGQWRTSTISFDSGAAPAASGQALSLRLINLSLPGSAQAPGIEVDFDQVQLLASPVDEPAARLLAMAGLAGLLVRRR